MSYLLRLLNASDTSVSLKHAAFAVVIVAGIVWLTYGLHHEGLTPNWVAAFASLLAAVTGAKLLGRSVGPAGSSAPDPVPGMDGGNKC